MIQHKGKSHVYDACRLHLWQAQRRPRRTMARQSFKSVQILWLPWSHGVSGSLYEAHLKANQGSQPELMQWFELFKVTPRFNRLFKTKQVTFYFATQLLTQKTRRFNWVKKPSLTFIESMGQLIMVNEWLRWSFHDYLGQVKMAWEQ